MPVVALERRSTGSQARRRDAILPADTPGQDGEGPAKSGRELLLLAVVRRGATLKSWCRHLEVLQDLADHGRIGEEGLGGPELILISCRHSHNNGSAS